MPFYEKDDQEMHLHAIVWFCIKRLHINLQTLKVSITLGHSYYMTLRFCSAQFCKQAIFRFSNIIITTYVFTTYISQPCITYISTHNQLLMEQNGALKKIYSSTQYLS